MDDYGWTIPYMFDTVPNYPEGHQLFPQANKFLWIVEIELEKQN